MARQVEHIEKLTNPPLREVVFTIKWALSNVADKVTYKYDTHLDEAYYRLRDMYRREDAPAARLSRITRMLPPGLGTPFTLNYRPFYTFQPEGSDYPLVQLGSGVFTMNQDGRTYRFDDFLEFVTDSVQKLSQAYGESELMPRPISFDFLLVNEVPLPDFDEHHRAAGPTKASQFMRDRFHLRLESPLHSFGDRMTLYRQEVSQRYRLSATGDIFTLSIEDVSEGPERQIVAFDLRVTTAEEAGGLTLAGAAPWLEAAHEHTRAVFMKIREDELLDDYFRAIPTAS